MWKCPDCGGTEPLEFQMGHLRWCPVEMQRKAKKEIEWLVARLPNPYSDLPFDYNPKEWFYNKFAEEFMWDSTWDEIPF